MADPVLKFPAEQKLTDKPAPQAAEAQRKTWGQFLRKKRRTLICWWSFR